MKQESAVALVIRARAASDEVIADPRRGRQVADQVANEARQVDDHEARVIALRAAGWAARELQEHDIAQRRLDEAVDVAREQGLDVRLCEALITRSAMYLELGKSHHAKKDVAAARAAAIGPVRGEVEFADGLLKDKTGDFDAAARAYRRALTLLDHDRPDVRVKAMNNLALTLARLGRYADAERLLDEAVELAETFSPAFTGIVLESRADVAIAGGRHIDALRRYEHAERALTAMGVQLVDLYLGKAKALLSLRLLDEAADAAAAAVAQVDGRPGGTLMLAEALLPQARIALAAGRLADAKESAARAELLFRRQRRPGWRATAALLRFSAEVADEQPTPSLLASVQRLERSLRRAGVVRERVDAGVLVGEVAAALGNRRTALAAFDRVAALARTEPVIVRMQGRLAAARAAELRRETRRLSAVCRVGLDELAAYRARFASAELRARAASHGTKLAAVGLRAAARTGRAEQIWTWIERSRAVVFLGGTAPSDDSLQPHLAQLRVLESELADMDADTPDRGAHLRRIAQLEQRVRNTSWVRSDQPRAWTPPSQSTLRRLRSDLGDRLLLQIGALDGQLLAVAVTRNGLRRVSLGRLGDVTGSLRQLGFALRRLTQAHGSIAGRRAAFAAAQHELRQMSEQLLSAVIDGGRLDVSEIIIAPPGELISVPWGSLPLIADRPVRVVPSAVSWWLSHRAMARSEGLVAVAGPDLEAAVDEVDQVAQLYRSAVRLTAGDATVTAVRSATRGAHTVHIAAHGRLRADSPTFSSIQLADGPLTVHDLESLVPPAHRWILAACDLGRPGRVAGPALEGVLATLLSAGSAAIVAATVSVPDLDTRPLMCELHRGLADGDSVARALWRSRRAVDVTDPSGFVAGVAFSCYGGG